MVPQLLASERQRHLMGAFSRKGRRAAERALPLGIEDAKESESIVGRCASAPTQ
jgi:hypothetical protein